LKISYNVGAKKHKLEMTSLELLSLIDILVSFSAVRDSFDDDGQALIDLRKVDKMLNRNGYKRRHS
jgi:hypothetical protein